MSSDISIEALGLGKAYRRYDSETARMAEVLFGRQGRGDLLWVLRDVGLTVRRGEAVGIVGRNGAGKSTLLKIISGTLTPSAGTARVQGRVATMLELGAGFHSDFTGRENARFAAAILGIDDAGFARISDRIEEFADIGAFYDRKVMEYSSGMFARLAFAVNIHCDADILIVDEILSVGDIAFQHKCLRFLRQFCDQGGTLLFVSHDDAAVRVLCDRTIWLHHGTVQDQGPPDRVLRRYHATMWQSQSQSGQFLVQETAPPAAEAAPEIADAPQFDPDTLPLAGTAQGRLTGFRFETADGAPLAMATGGAELVLASRVQADTDLAGAAVHFLFRNRLGQVVFSGRTSPAHLAAGQTVASRFYFVLPYVPTGSYAVDLVLTATEGGAETLVARHGPNLIGVQTQHISQGLANIRLQSVEMRVQS